MYLRHHRHHPCRSRHPFAGHMGRHRRGPGRIGRFLEHGDLRFVILALIEEQPRHGYELIKALEERTGGAYRPSAGVVYPTLSLLEDEGFVRQAGGETGRKLYEITDAGREALAGARPAVDAVFARMDEAASASESSRPRIERAMTNLGLALRNRLVRPLSDEEVDRIVKILDETTAKVEKP
jgi:DNA-binding PadR family transcriptional regulator